MDLGLKDKTYKNDTICTDIKGYWFEYTGY